MTARTATPLSPARRARARRARMLWSAGVAPLVVGLLWFAWPMVAAGPAVRSASHTSTGDRSGYFWMDAIADHDVVERWRADYNQGTVRLLAGEGWAAVEPLRQALATVPEVEADEYAQYCMVLDNLVLAYTAQADHTTDPDEAGRAVADAAQLRSDPRCTSQDDSQDSTQPPQQDPQPDGQGEQGGDDEAEQDRQRDLEERQRGSDADAEQFRQGGTPDLTDPGGGEQPDGDRPGAHQDW